MTVKDFLTLIHPITVCDLDTDIEFSLFMNELEIHCKKGQFECTVRATNVPVNTK